MLCKHYERQVLLDMLDPKSASGIFKVPHNEKVRLTLDLMEPACEMRALIRRFAREFDFPCNDV